MKKFYIIINDATGEPISTKHYDTFSEAVAALEKLPEIRDGYDVTALLMFDRKEQQS